MTPANKFDPFPLLCIRNDPHSHQPSPPILEPNSVTALDPLDLQTAPPLWPDRRPTPLIANRRHDCNPEHRANSPCPCSITQRPRPSFSPVRRPRPAAPSIPFTIDHRPIPRDPVTPPAPLPTISSPLASAAADPCHGRPSRPPAAQLRPSISATVLDQHRRTQPKLFPCFLSRVSSLRNCFLYRFLGKEIEAPFEKGQVTVRPSNLPSLPQASSNFDMEEAREEEEVLYEIRHHANMPFSSDSFKQEVGGGSKEGWRSYLSLQGAKQFKERWAQYKRPKILKKRRSLFVSPNGKYVAIAAGNQITILQKDDEYMSPIGIYTSNDRLSVFTNGAWLELEGILGFIDDMSTLYLIKSSGEELARRTRRQLKLSAPICDLIVQSDVNSEKSFWCGFCIFTEDGLLYHVDISQEASACIYTIPPSRNHLKDEKQFPQNLSCLDFHPDLSCGVLVGASSVSANLINDSGLYSVYLFRLTTTSELELLFCSPQFQGLFLASKDYIGPFTSPKVSISPHVKHVAVLDLTGRVNVFNLDMEKFSLSHASFAERNFSHISDSLTHESKESKHDTVDISWWNDDILILAKREGHISMYSIVSGIKLIENDPIFCMPVIERMKHHHEHIFVLENRSSDENISDSEHTKDRNMQHIVPITSLNESQLLNGKLCWRLLSLSGKSVSEMYTVLISNQHYQSALDFASRHGLDKNEVFKEQWLHSEQGIHEINVLLPKITDQMFVLSECLDKVGPTEDAVKSLLSYGLRITEEYKFLDKHAESSTIWDFRIIRLQLLQYRDKLETFVGINMGRFSTQEYRKFRVIPLSESAISLAESGKIGALNLLFKRHPYSLSPRILDILCAIPETVPVQSYSQLLPGRSSPSTVSLRESDWIECEKMISFINNLPTNSEKSIQLRTENILKQSVGLVWPSITELFGWYKNRTRDIDNLSGQLDNCLSLLEFACRKGIMELQQFLEDTSYLHQLIYADDREEDFAMCLVTWEQLSDYEKFRMMLKGAKDETVVRKLRETAIPFMKKRFCPVLVDSENKMKEGRGFPYQDDRDSFIVRWLKEIAADNLLELCLAVIENGCGDSPVDGLFNDEAEIIETALHCIYLCTLTDQWNIMASILSILPRRTVREYINKDFSPRHGTPSLGIPRFSYLRSQLGKSEKQLSPVSLHDGEPAPQNSRGFVEHLDNNASDDKLERRIKVAEGHVEVGRLLAFYQVPKPMSFFLGVKSDEKNVKQLLRLILSKFGRRQPGRSDNDWANMWRDMQCFQEKAFPFLDTEYMLIEYCRGLLKAGKFSLARNYLKGTGSVTLATEKAESLVIQAAREYFFSASSLSCTEIWKAKECLSLFPNSKIVQAEADIIDALTIRLPNLGVTLLPMQFKQIKNPMEIINMVISRQPGAYLNVDELVEIAKLLGLSSSDDIAAVEEAIAREAAVAGDLQLAFDLCLVLAKKGHGSIWDLCAAIARGPHLDNMDASSRKQLLSFALSHCDEESIGELLHAWKDVDVLMQCENLMVSTQTSPPNYSIQGSSVIPLSVQTIRDIFDLRDSSKTVHQNTNFLENVSDEVDLDNIKDILFKVGKELSFNEDGISWDSLLRENKKVLSFAALELPWLLELSGKEEYGKRAENPPKGHYISIKTQALISILYWLAGNNFAPSDDLIAAIAKSIMESPASKEEDVLGCLFLLNLVDAFQGVEIIEEQLKQREGYQEMFSIMNIGMAYSSLQNSHRECSSPDERRKLLLHKFQEKHASFSSDELEQIDQAQSTFWREWKTKLEEQKHVADQARMLEQIIPGIETTRFLSGDAEYIKTVIFSFIDSTNIDKNHILKEAVKLADIYGLNRNEVLLRFFGSALVSNHWGNDDILNEILEFREDIVKCAKDVITMISTVVYPGIDGHNKQRLSYIYGILSACYLHLKKTEEQALAALTCQYQQHKKHNLEPFQFYKVLEQECQRASFINALDFKNIAGLDDLNFEHINEEISNNIHESTVEALADMMQALASIYSDSDATVGLISWQAIYKHHIQSCLSYLESEIESSCNNSMNPEDLQEIIGKIELNFDVCKKYIRSLAEADQSCIIGRYHTLCIPPCSSSWKLSDESAQKTLLTALLSFWIKMADDEGINTKRLARCLKILKKLLAEDDISTGCLWSTITCYIKLGLKGGLNTYTSSLLQAMILSGCGFTFIAQVYSKAELHLTSLNLDGKLNNLVDLYTYLMEKALLDLSRGCEEHQDLQHLLSSLSKLDDGDYAEDLSAIRCRVWGKLTAFSDDMQLESHLRVYVLELMQAITGQNLTSLSAEIVSIVQPWEGWEYSCFPTNSLTTTERFEGSSNSITNTLIALKSTKLLATISPDFKITPEDLITLDSAFSCFLHLSELALSLPDLNVLRAVLEEWEVLFPSNKEKAAAVESSVEEFNNWSSDEWDNEGWENLPEEELVKTEGSKNESFSIRPLHSCWMEIIKKLVGLSKLDLVMEMLDKSFSKSDGVEVLIDEDEVQCLYNLVLSIDRFSALKIMLLLPYKGPLLQCLHAFESALPNNAIYRVDNGYELLILVLSSGVLKDIATNPNFGKVLTYLCHLVGYLARFCQEDLRNDKDGLDRKRVLVFCTILLPCFISQLVEAGQCLLAGYIVSQWMHTHSSLGLVDVVEASLRKYLEVQFFATGGESACESCGSFVYALSRLRGKVRSMLESAISALPTDTPR